MKVSYYCQHVLGIGHFHRSLEICRAVARRHPTTLIVGGPPVAVDQPDLEILRLPGLQMDNQFKGLIPYDRGLSLEEVKEQRARQLYNHFQQNSPDIFITELYPFGRKAFRFELDPVLHYIREGQLEDCFCVSSVRDILVEKKTGRDKFETRAVNTLNSYYDGVLVHADPTVITLDETFGRLSDIQTPLHYTGFVTRAALGTERQRIRGDLGLEPGDTLIVASLGGGNVGSELLLNTIEAFSRLDDLPSRRLQLFSGPYCDNRVYEQLHNKTGGYSGHIRLQRFTNRFPDWLRAADLSISMAGYNTCMNLVQTGIPALVYPFGQNREQRLRAQRLARTTPISVLEDEDLQPQCLARRIRRQLAVERRENTIDLNGAEQSAAQLEKWLRKKTLS